MFGISQPITHGTRSASVTSELEPHVMSFRLDASPGMPFSLSYKLISLSVLACLMLGFFLWQQTGQMWLVQVSAWTGLALAALFYPGWVQYHRVHQYESAACVELDSKNQLIKYTHEKEQINILFHPSQVEACEVHICMMLPNRIDTLWLQLKDGPRIMISSLLAEPSELMRTIRKPYSLRKRWFPVLKMAQKEMGRR